MTKLITEQGWQFFSAAAVLIGDNCYDMDGLTEQQRLYVSGKLEEQALNAAFAGHAKFKAKQLPEYNGLFVPKLR